MHFEHAMVTMPWFGWIAIVAILSGSITGTIRMWIMHRERIELIRQGINPDADPSVQKTTIREL